MNTSERNLAKDTLAPEQPGIEPPTSHLVDDLNSKKGDNEKRIVSTSDSFSTCCSLSTNSYCHSLLIFIKLLDYWRFLGWVYAVKTNAYHCLRSNTDPLKTEDDRTVSVKPQLTSPAALTKRHWQNPREGNRFLPHNYFLNILYTWV